MNKVDAICLHLLVFVFVSDIFIPQFYQEFVNLKRNKNTEVVFFKWESSNYEIQVYLFQKKKSSIYLFLGGN